jgi:hypothetical protein
MARLSARHHIRFFPAVAPLLPAVAPLLSSVSKAFYPSEPQNAGGLVHLTTKVVSGKSPLRCESERRTKGICVSPRRLRHWLTWETMGDASLGDTSGSYLPVSTEEGFALPLSLTS